tara:strand:- start:3397 stop:3549 length:153 start_codon:yes stop_codon:yes gene_type:complete
VAVDSGFLLILFIDVVGLAIAVWFITSRLKSKIVEVEERKSYRWKQSKEE